MIVGFAALLVVCVALTWLLARHRYGGPGRAVDPRLAQLAALLGTASSDVQAWRDRVTEDLCRLVGADHAGVWAVAGQELEPVSVDPGSSWSQDERVHLGESVLGHAWATGSSLVLGDLRAHPASHGRPLRTASAIVVTGRVDDEVRLLLTLEWSRATEPARDALQLLEPVADALAAGWATSQRTQVAYGVQTRFLTLIGHEMRTPLTAVLGACELLARDADRLGEEGRASVLDLARRGSLRLQKMVTSLLLAAHLEQGELAYEVRPVGLLEEIGPAVERLRAMSVDVVVPRDLTAMADKDHLGKVLEELLDNAVRHGAAPIRLTAAVVGDAVRLDIADAGVGVPDDVLSRMRERFSRSDTERLHKPGAGLGLYLASRLLEGMGGRLELWSEPGAGCHATVWLEPGGARVVDVTRFVRRRHVGLTMRSGSVDSDEMAAEAVDLRD